MSLFFKSKKKIIATVDTPEQSSIREKLYKQNLEVVDKNKTLSLLGKLYEISILTLAPKDLAIRICKTIQTDFSFELAGIMLYDQRTDTLSPLAFAESERFLSAQSDFRTLLDTVTIPNITRHRFLKDVVVGRTMGYTEEITDIWDSVIPRDKFIKIEEQSHVRSSLIFPLIIENQVVGIFLASLNRDGKHLASYEKDSIKSFINVIAVALDKAFLYEQLRITNRELETSNERQEGLIHFISHEIKGYLTKNEGAFSGIVEGDYGTVSEEAKTLAQTALVDTRKGVNTVIDILSASNLKKGTVTYNNVPFDIKSSVETTITELKPAAVAKGLTLKVVIDPGEYTFTGDEKQIRDHVIRNLIDNSIRYTPSGTIEIRLTKKDSVINFSVKDTGVGITDEDKVRLFTEGGHGKDSQKVNVSSTGYGLFIAKQIIEAYKGKIGAKSEGASKGSTFYFSLPVNFTP